MYPGLHVQVKPPCVFAQRPFALQFAAPVVHSLTSVHNVPVPV
jgi:hypothetical protein